MSKIPAPAPSDHVTIEENAYAKVFRRVMPFIIICYVVAYLDRINIGFAKLQMEIDLGFSETVYGLGAGMFFIGYFFFEVPSNLIMYRVGARLWIARIMITWGLISACFVFVKTPFWFPRSEMAHRPGKAAPGGKYRGRLKRQENEPSFVGWSPEGRARVDDECDLLLFRYGSLRPRVLVAHAAEGNRSEE